MMMATRRTRLWMTAVLAMGAAGAAAFAQAEDAATDDAAESKKWDVDSWDEATVEQVIDTDEGTWMNLDVSPDGREIVFDLLGDIYILPIEGGTAKPLTSGVAWDMQPRFSPDGDEIAFTSDRTGKNGKGGDNIWVMKRDGSDVRQITEETFRLYNGAAGTPDGEYIVARKHFTSRRSLGAGEMWMHHRSGVEGGATGGLQLTEKRTDQKDVNEPIFSPDGRYLYYSEDATPGGTFEYGKDSHKEIYVINRLDLERGETEEYISGPGGACRPTPSPDGKTIAFVRRYDGRTALHLFDTASGAVRMVHDDLERDMQEAWAIHGVYPSFAWTPDGESIVVWARGKIRRIDLATGSATVIPFRVKDTRMVAPVVRFPVEVAPEEFDVKAIRWTSVSPRGDQVAYQALGHIYVKDLPTGEPRRLTNQNDHFEFCPSFSRDGRQVVFATWSDDEYGAIRVADVATGRTRQITTAPGHYIDPVFSPDGQTIVASKIAGGWLRSPLWSREAGVYAWPAQGGEPTLITKNGSEPQFGAENDRVYLQRSAYEKDADNTKLFSIGLDGKEEREHFTSAWATDYCVSPDGRWVAFVERFNVHIAPFVRTGRSVSIGPKGGSMPIAKVSADAGEWIHFSGDSSSLHWSLGPTLYTRELNETFAFLDGAAEEPAEPEAEGVHIGFTTEYDAPSGTVALVGGRIVTMRNGTDEIIEDGVIVIEGNRIAAVGSRNAVSVPRGAHVIDVSGQTILPGYVDVHAHGAMGTNGIIPQRNWVDLARLAFGVTTVHDPSNDTNTIFAASELAKAGLITAPRTYSTGTILYGASGSFKAEVDSLEDAEFHIRRMKAIGAISVKSYNQPRRDQRQQVITAARKHGIMVVPEGGSTFMHNMTMIVDGHTGIEHTLPVEIVYDDVLDLWRDTGVGYTPTLSVAYGGIPGEEYFYNVDDVWENPKVATVLPPHVINPRARRREKAPLEDYNHMLVARIAKQVIDQGGTAHAGGHGQLNGIDTHWEMWGFVQGGMTPFEALRSGTLQGAQYLGFDGDIGTIEAGKLADIVVIKEGHDPLVNVRDSQEIEYVVANGRVFEAETMNEIGNHPRQRGPLFWESDDFDGIGMMPPAWSGGVGGGANTMCSWMHP
ncbi:MAG: amidohydrolase family protein [Planctomycetota bacterium]|nr:amidohydrolase family protein [Planctomycetota bacterium]